MKKFLTMLIVVLIAVGMLSTIDATSKSEFKTKSVETTQKKAAKAKKKKKKAKYYTKRCLLTAYCPCRSCSGGYGTQTVMGRRAKEGRTVAGGRVFRLGQKVVINGHTYTVEDRGGGVNGYHIDIYFSNHAKVRRFGKKYRKVKIYY